jgi:hypothetical protein
MRVRFRRCPEALFRQDVDHLQRNQNRDSLLQEKMLEDSPFHKFPAKGDLGFDEAH